MSDGVATVFFGGPLDGDIIVVPEGAHAFYKLIPKTRLLEDIVQEDTAVPQLVRQLAHKYQRYRDKMYYVGEVWK